MAQSPCSRRRSVRLYGAASALFCLCAPHQRLSAPIAGDAADATQRSTPPNRAAVGTINGVLQFLLAAANRYWPERTPFLASVARGTRNMVDRWLIAVRDQAQDVVRGGENHQERDQGDSDSQPDLLRPLAQWAPAQALKGVKREVAAVEQRHWQQVHQTDRDRKPRGETEELPKADFRHFSSHLRRADQSGHLIG